VLHCVIPKLSIKQVALKMWFFSADWYIGYVLHILWSCVIRMLA